MELNYAKQFHLIELLQIFGCVWMLSLAISIEDVSVVAFKYQIQHKKCINHNTRHHHSSYVYITLYLILEIHKVLSIVTCTVAINKNIETCTYLHRVTLTQFWALLLYIDVLVRHIPCDKEMIENRNQKQGKQNITKWWYIL